MISPAVRAWIADPVEQLAEEFLGRRRQGEGVSITDYARETPANWAQRIRDLFPTLLLMEELRPDTTSARSRSAAMTQASAKETLQRVGDFRILREIGRGGMGSSTRRNRSRWGGGWREGVAGRLRGLAPRGYSGFSARRRRPARLHHTNIVPVFGVGQQDGIHYYVMQFIDGEGLDKVLHALAAGATSPKAIPCVEEAPRPEADGCSARFPPPRRPRCCCRTTDARLANGGFRIAGTRGGDGRGALVGAGRFALLAKRGRGWDSGRRRPAVRPINKGPCTATSSRPTCSWTTAARCISLFCA